MLNTTLPHLKCPRRHWHKKGKVQCGSSLELFAKQTLQIKAIEPSFEVVSGHLTCQQCHSQFPILGGVALLTDDVRNYLLHHVKGIAQVISDSEIPKEYLHDFLEAKEEMLSSQAEHIEEDLEAERVNALYIMNHYLKAEPQTQPVWWKPQNSQKGSPLIDSLIREHWDQGPFSIIQKWVKELSLKNPSLDVIELGCSVGGLYSALQPHLHSYLGVDSSFASIALARHLVLGVSLQTSLRIPEDLLQGPVSREIKINPLHLPSSSADFIVGDLENLPVKKNRWDLSIALNTIDMLDEPSELPLLQNELLKDQGYAIQSSPYIWHEVVAKKLRSKLKHEKSKIQDSAQAVEWLYQQAGFEIQSTENDVPWLFFKHVRQMEIYSVHIFNAKKIMDSPIPSKKKIER